MSGPCDILISFLELSNRPNAAPEVEDMWYRKRDEMFHIAVACGVGDIFKKIGSIIHKEELLNVKKMLEVTDACMAQLFEETDISFE